MQLHYPHRKRKDSTGSDSHDGIHGSPEALSVPGGGKVGPTVPDIEDHSETDEGRALEEELAVLLKEAEEARELGKKEIALLYGGKGKGKDREIWKGFPDMEDPTGEYVWECTYSTLLPGYKLIHKFCTRIKEGMSHYLRRCLAYYQAVRIWKSLFLRFSTIPSRSHTLYIDQQTYTRSIIKIHTLQPRRRPNSSPLVKRQIISTPAEN